MILQIILIVAILFIAYYILGRRNTHSGKAWKKISLIALLTSMILVVIFPDTTNIIAQKLGVGRGADLLLYGNIVIFVFYMINNYLQQQDSRDRLYRLARAVALKEAISRYRLEDKDS